MIVTCEGCETSFHVGDGLVKPSGSKVRCSKCRHVFTAYAPAQEADSIEPLTLTDELPPAAASDGVSAPDGIESELDALFASSEMAETGLSADDPPPELLNVEELIGSAEQEEGILGGASPEEEGEHELDLDLDLDVIEEAGDVAEVTDDRGHPEVATGTEAADHGGERELDFSLDLEPVAEPENGELLPPALDELEIDLDALDDVEEVSASAPESSQTGPETDHEELDLDLDLESLGLEDSDLGEGEFVDMAAGDDADSAGVDLPEPGENDVPALDDMGLDLGMEAESAGSEADDQAAGGDELDLSDLEKMLEGGEVMAAEKSEPAEEPIDLDLDLDLQTEVLPADQSAEEAEDLDLGAIAAELDTGDSSAIEKEAEDLDLDFLSETEHAEPESAAVSGGAVDELDFSDVADTLDLGGDFSDEKSAEEQELELLFEDELSGASVVQESEATRDTDAALLDIETLLEDDGGRGEESVTVQTGDMEIEIEPLRKGLEDRLLDDPAQADGLQVSGASASAAEAETDEFSTDEFTNTGLTGATDMLEAPAAAEPSFADVAAPARTGSRKPLWALLAALLLGIAVLVVPRILGIHIPFLSDIQIPLIGDLFDSETKDPLGSLKLAPMAETISAEFIDNQTLGRLCVIKGRVRNDYGHPRSHIQVTAKLYTKDKAVAKSATVFAGNILAQAELASLDLAAISARTNLKAGDNNVNVAVPPGRTIPFMVVLDKLPADADEYSVEVGGSTK